MPKSSGVGRVIKQIPSDLVVVWFLATWAIVATLGNIDDSAVRVALGILAVLFAPGYALVAALFPAEPSGVRLLSQIDRSYVSGSERVTAGERLVLGVGLSVCLVPLLGISLNYAAGSLTATSLLRTIGAATLCLTIVAAVRRQRIPLEERYNPQPMKAVLAAGRRTPLLWKGSSVTILVVVGLVISASGIGFAALRTDQGEQFTEFYLLTEDPETGEYVAGNYPDTIGRAGDETVQVGVTNNEGETKAYTVVVLAQAIDEDGNVQRVRRLDTFDVTVQSGETVIEPHTIRTEMTGQNLRITYLLYVESPPDGTNLRVDNAYRAVHFWTEVPEPGSA